MIPTDTERLYYTWLEENHPDEYRLRVEEEDYFYSLEKQWAASLPTERDFLLAFPEGIKEQIKDLKHERSVLMEHTRELKNQLVTTNSSNTSVYELLITTNDDRLVAIRDQLTKLEWYTKPKAHKEELDIARAKAVPITNLIEFKRKVAKCLWHDDKNPSMTYFPSTNKVWCFSCQNGGDSIDVTMKLWDLSIKEAITKLTNA